MEASSSALISNGPQLPPSLASYLPLDRVCSQKERHEIYVKAIQKAGPRRAQKVDVVDPTDKYNVPGWDWSYSEELLRSDAVESTGDLSGAGCACVGSCEASSETCSCLERNRIFGDGWYDGFPYAERKAGKKDRNPNKRVIKDLSCPVFECHEGCKCSPDCINRVRTTARRARDPALTQI